MNSRIRTPRWPRPFVEWRASVEKFLEKLSRLTGLQIEIEGARLAGTGNDGHQRFKVAPGTRAVTGRPLAVTMDGSSAYVEGSTILGTVPTIGGTLLNDATPPALTVPASGTRHVVINVVLSPTVAGGFVFPIVTVSSISIALEEDLPNASHLLSATGTYKVLLATIVDRVITQQSGYGPISGEVCDTLDGTSRATLVLKWGSAT